MQLQVISYGVAQKADVTLLARDPAFRKATRSMLMAAASVGTALASQGLDEKIKSAPNLFGLIVGSSFGEIETTKDFLKTLAESGAARPILFQNSLHNSIAGFLSIQYKLNGPVITVSHGYFSDEQAIEAASLILSDGLCEICIVTVVDTFIEELMISDSESQNSQENAITLLMTTPDIAQRENLKVLLTIGEMRTDRQLSRETPAHSLVARADSGALHRLHREILSEKSRGKMEIKKPRGAFSSIKWKKS